ncbi:uncharacterized protein PG998_008129 [Apiospora kogelbergensis]|uniref:uncharacterized protein n=1 Tax=Apiospora kogelbergensis TaxID=1337665 RepID=UPI003131B6F7
MGCRADVESSPVPFLARYLNYRVSRPLGLPESRYATIEPYLQWMLQELLGPTAGEDEKYEALLALCHHINDYDYASVVATRWWGGDPGWYTGITQNLDCLTEPELRGMFGGTATLLPAAITLGLETIYEPAIAAIQRPLMSLDPIWATVGSHTVNFRAICRSLGNPLYAAVRVRNPDLVRRLLHLGLSVNGNEANALTGAVQGNNMDMLNLLLAPPYGKPPNSTSVQSAIAVGATLGRTECVARLIDYSRGESIRRDGLGWDVNRALLRAVYNNHVDAADMLIHEGAEFPTLFRPGRGTMGLNAPTIVEIAAWRGHAGVLKLLLSRSAGVSIQTVQAAMAGNHVETLRILLGNPYVRQLDQYSWWGVLADGANLGCTEAILYLINEAKVLNIAGILKSDDPEAVYLSGVAGTLCSRGNYRAVEALIQAGLPVDHNCTLDPDDDEPDENVASVEMRLMDLAVNSLAPGAAETVQMLARYGASPAAKRAKQYLPCEWKSNMPQNRGVQVVANGNGGSSRIGA